MTSPCRALRNKARLRRSGMTPWEPCTRRTSWRVPSGWEAAGASALQAAAPESATEYRPVVQISPDPSSAGQEDFASAVFSELSSLAAERPKVETTRAGLAKRTPVEREEEPEERGCCGTIGASRR